MNPLLWIGVAIGVIIAVWGAIARHQAEGRGYETAIAIGSLLVTVCFGIPYFNGPPHLTAEVATTPSPSIAPAQTATPNPENAISVKLVSVNTVGTPGPDGKVPVRVLYQITANASIVSAYGQAELPFADSCDGGIVSIEEQRLPRGAAVERSVTVLCSQDDARRLASFATFNMSWHPANVIFE